MSTGILQPAVARRLHLLGAGALLVVAFAGSLRLFEALWHRDALADISQQPGGRMGALIVVALSAVIHELLHVFGWSFLARAPWRSISFRPTWRGMGFVAHVDVALPIRAYRASAALPALILGGLPIVLGLMTGFGLLALWGLFFLLECFTDVVAILATRQVPPRSWVRPHPSALGCQVVAETNGAAT